MTVAQGINKTVAYKVQSGLGSAASGSGGQLLRRESAAFNITKDTYSNNEIASHQQHTGDIAGIGRTAATLSGVASCSTYGDFEAAILRKAWAATSAISSLTLAIAASGSDWTVTRSTGSFLTDGVKIGDVGQLSGASLNVANVGVNLIVVGVTALALTVHVPTGSALVAESGKTSCTFTIGGKKTWVPTSGHTNLYYTFEEAFADLTRYHVYQDVQVGSLELNVPATGNVAVNLGFVGLGSKVTSGTQSLTSPAAETTTSVLESGQGAVIIGGSARSGVTSVRMTIDGGVTGGEAVVGSNQLPDTQKGRVKVSGRITQVYTDDTDSTAFLDQTTTSLIVFLPDDGTDGADYQCIVLPEIKLFSDNADDGEKQIVRTYNFTAQICSSGGAAAANNQTICSIQDSTIS